MMRDLLDAIEDKPESGARLCVLGLASGMDMGDALVGHVGQLLVALVRARKCPFRVWVRS